MSKLMLVVLCYGFDQSAICLPSTDFETVAWHECVELRDAGNSYLYQEEGLKGVDFEGNLECVYKTELGIYQRKEALGQ